jgi:DNA invertase Pin-like site-specific DNA recombinase
MYRSRSVPPLFGKERIRRPSPSTASANRDREPKLPRPPPKRAQIAGDRARSRFAETVPPSDHQARGLLDKIWCYHFDIVPRTTDGRQWHSAAIYLRVSRDDQTTENQRLVLARVAEHPGWTIVQTYEDQGISGAKGRDQRPAFDAVRRRYDILMVWSIDRLGRSVLHVAIALAELDAASVRLYCDQQGIDSSTPMDRAMIPMASVFGEQERSMLRSRVLAGLDRVRQQGKKLGRPRVSAKVEEAIRRHLNAGKGILKVAALVGVGSGTVQRVRREMVEQLVEVA